MDVYDKSPKKISLQQLADISVTTDFFQCHEVVGMAAGKWIKALKPLFSTSFSEDTKKWMMIAWVFNSKDILQQTEKIAMQQGKGSFKTSNLPIPNSIKDKIDKARQEYMDLLQVNIAARIQDLLMTPSTGPYGHSSCQPECGAVYVGLILRTLNEMKISYSAGIPSTLPSRRHAPLFTVSFGRLSPISINTMVNGWKLTSTYYGRCSIDGNPFGTDVKRAAQNLPTSLPNSEILPSK
ncbi:uncharacterized protein PGRI_093500 [Penicillium griseofulvum]|uniref:Uncharacterized protein n=1 Tax=Penicillium patulum TaxID=5078 RepID=A0A135LQT9_PENPA|nr:uncharacterized protein PGRI_093500 [Penicillium griseofulvum]KXG51338.1 hypothetical protein PGRI_093500 [Penicillium griseofulvum]